VTLLVLMLILCLFSLILLSGDPISYFGTKSSSLAYCLAVYLPVMALCVLAYRRLASAGP